MAKILDNPHGGRRMIRLSSEDIMMIMAMMQTQFSGSPASYHDIEARLTHSPFYLPEELA